MVQDIRWHQRFANFKKAFNLLKDAVDLDEYSELEREGLIQRFEYTYELAWNTIKDFLENQGYQNITGSKDAIRQAFQSGLITDAEKWFDIIESRKLSSHTYDEDKAVEIANKVKEDYFYVFKEIVGRLEKELEKEKGAT